MWQPTIPNEARASRKRRRMPAFLRMPVETVSLTIADLPAAFDGLRVCQLTDIHVGGSINPHKLDRIVRQANGLGADFFVLTGDYIEGHQGQWADPCMRVLAGLNAPKYAVLGNHDYWGGKHLAEEACDRHGIRLLANEHALIERGDAKLAVAGVVDLWCDRPDLRRALAGVGDDVPRLLLCHNPDFAEEMPRERVDLMMSGHTHGGQVRVFGKHFGPSTYGDKYLAGLVDAGDTKVYVSRGIGTSVVPIRIGAPPELTLFELRRPTD